MSTLTQMQPLRSHAEIITHSGRNHLLSINRSGCVTFGSVKVGLYGRRELLMCERSLFNPIEFIQCSGERSFGSTEELKRPFSGV